MESLGDSIRRDRESGHTRLFVPDGADRAPGYRLCDDLSVDDHRQGYRCPGCGFIAWDWRDLAGFARAAKIADHDIDADQEYP